MLSNFCVFNYPWDRLISLQDSELLPLLVWGIFRFEGISYNLPRWLGGLEVVRMWGWMIGGYWLRCPIRAWFLPGKRVDKISQLSSLLWGRSIFRRDHREVIYPLPPCTWGEYVHCKFIMCFFFWNAQSNDLSRFSFVMYRNL